jgi:hypothetical protein
MLMELALARARDKAERRDRELRAMLDAFYIACNGKQIIIKLENNVSHS